MSAVVKLRQAGFTVQLLDGERIGLVPASNLTDTWRQFIADNRPELIAELKAESANQSIAESEAPPAESEPRAAVADPINQSCHIQIGHPNLEAVAVTLYLETGGEIHVVVIPSENVLTLCAAGNAYFLIQPAIRTKQAAIVLTNGAGALMIADRRRDTVQASQHPAEPTQPEPKRCSECRHDVRSLYNPESGLTRCAVRDDVPMKIPGTRFVECSMFEAAL